MGNNRNSNHERTDLDRCYPVDLRQPLYSPRNQGPFLFGLWRFGRARNTRPPNEPIRGSLEVLMKSIAATFGCGWNTPHNPNPTRLHLSCELGPRRAFRPKRLRPRQCPRLLATRREAWSRSRCPVDWCPEPGSDALPPPTPAPRARGALFGSETAVWLEALRLNRSVDEGVVVQDDSD